MESEQPSPTSMVSEQASLQESASWQPETLFRTCLSSLADSETFGAMMAAEADSRGFFMAKKKAFVGDGQSYNWTIQQRWFPGFVAILDFVHAVEYVYTAAKTIHAEIARRWQQYVAWATACWQGETTRVIADLRAWQSHLGPPPEGGASAPSIGAVRPAAVPSISTSKPAGAVSILIRRETGSRRSAIDRCSPGPRLPVDSPGAKHSLCALSVNGPARTGPPRRRRAHGRSTSPWRRPARDSASRSPHAPRGSSGSSRRAPSASSSRRGRTRDPS